MEFVVTNRGLSAIRSNRPLYRNVRGQFVPAERSPGNVVHAYQYVTGFWKVSSEIPVKSTRPQKNITLSYLRDYDHWRGEETKQAEHFQQLLN